MRTIVTFLEKQKDNPKIAFRDETQAISFQDILASAQIIGTNLAHSIEEGEPIAILSGRHIHTIAAYLGIVYAGNYYAPIDGDMPLARIQKILDILQPKVLIVDGLFKEMVSSFAYQGNVLQLEELEKGVAESKLLEKRTAHFEEKTPLYVLFTSGSSGIPKGVLTGQESVMNYIEAVSEVLRVQEDDVLGNQAPLDYIAAIRDIYIPFLTGCSTVILPKKQFTLPELLFETFQQEHVTLLCWSVAGLETLVKLNAFDCVDSLKPTQLRCILFSGSIMPAKVLRLLQEQLPHTRFINQYGPTEATASCTYYEVNHLVEEDEVLPIGKPYKNYEVFVIKDGHLASPGEIGEIYVKGVGVTLGYFKDEERTNVSYVDNPLDENDEEKVYRTGDLGSVREDGLLEFHGRMDRQIKHFGHRIELDEIEVLAKQLPGMQNCYSYYEQDKECLCLAYVGDITKAEIVKAYRSNLPGYMVPRKIVQLDVMPTLPNGKIDMQKLKEKL